MDYLLQFSVLVEGQVKAFSDLILFWPDYMLCGDRVVVFHFCFVFIFVLIFSNEN